MFHVGDWLLHVHQHFPAAYKGAAERTGFDSRTLRQAKWVCKAVPPERRRASLTFAHHQEVASLEPHLQKKWLKSAEKENATKAQLRAWIKHGKVITAKEADKIAKEKLKNKGHKNIFEFLGYVDAHIGKLENEKGPADTWTQDECERMLEAFERVMRFLGRLAVGAKIDENNS